MMLPKPGTHTRENKLHGVAVAKDCARYGLSSPIKGNFRDILFDDAYLDKKQDATRLLKLSLKHGHVLQGENENSLSKIWHE